MGMSLTPALAQITHGRGIGALSLLVFFTERMVPKMYKCVWWSMRKRKYGASSQSMWMRRETERERERERGQVVVFAMRLRQWKNIRATMRL